MLSHSNSVNNHTFNSIWFEFEWGKHNWNWLTDKARKKSRIQINQNNERKNHRTGVSQSHVFDWPNSPNRFSIELQALDGWVETFICCLSQRVNDAEHIYSLIRLQSMRWVNVWLWSVKQSCGSFLLFCFFALYLTSLFFAYVWNGK